jgi:WD40 repeat protein
MSQATPSLPAGVESRSRRASAALVERRVPPWLLLLLFPACAVTAVGTAGRDLAGLKDSPRGYLSGEVVALSRLSALDSRDFAWAIDVSRAPAAVAYTHLAAQQFRLALWELEPTLKALADPGLNEVRHDVEAVSFSPDGARVATASRDGSLRVFSRTGALLHKVRTDEPLTAVAYSPDGRYLVTGSAKGLVTVLRADALRYGTEARAHADEVRSLSFDAKGTLFTGGWDKAIRSFNLREEEGTATQARVRFERQEGLATLHGSVDDRTPVTFGYDARAPFTTLSSAVAQAAGIDVALLTETVKVQTSSGPSLLKLARNQTVVFKALRTSGVDIAVCDTCAPPGIDGLLGETFLSHADVAFDPAAAEAVITAKGPGDGSRTHEVVLTSGVHLRFAEYVNDFTVDRAGARLGVAFGEKKAERTLDVYQREKRKVEEPLAEANAGAVVDAATGAVLARHVVHRGTVATAAISPDGRALATGGWDKELFVFAEGAKEPVHRSTFGWSVRRVRFSPDGRFLGAAAWTPQTGYAEKDSDPSAMVFDVRYRSAEPR